MTIAQTPSVFEVRVLVVNALAVAPEEQRQCDGGTSDIHNDQNHDQHQPALVCGVWRRGLARKRENEVKHRV